MGAIYKKYGRGGFSNPYSRTMAMRPIPFRRRRPPARARTAAPLRMGLRVRTKLGSNTRVATTRKPRQLGKASITGKNTSVSYTTVGRSKPISRMLLNKLMGHNVIQENSSTNTSSTQGLQGIAETRMLDRTDLEKIKLAANGGVATENDVQLFLKTCKLRYYIRNQSNQPVKMTIYDIATRNTGYTSTIDTPTEAWNFGYNDMGTASQSLTIGATPHQSAEFRRQFIITKVTNVPMEAGQQHEHLVTKNMNWFVNSTKWANTSAQCVKGLTFFSLFVFHGALGHESLTPGTVSFMPVRMDVAVFRKYQFAYLTQNKPTYTLADTLPKTIVDWDFMGENQDIDADLIQA